jgi:hypothetical protein
MDREIVIKEFEHLLNAAKGNYQDFVDLTVDGGEEILALLKEQEEQKRKWLQCIADNQLANAPRDWHEFMSIDDHLENRYKKGIYDGLQMAWEILTNE